MNQSTGPRTEAGKARSSMNALKTGIYSHSMLLPGEKIEDYEQLANEYYDRFSPVTPELRDQLDLAIVNAWFLRRFARVQSEVFLRAFESTSSPSKDAPLGQAFVNYSNTFARLNRIVNSTQRNFNLALQEIERLRQPEPEPQPEPVPAPQPQEPEPLTPPDQFVPSTPAEAPQPALRTRQGIHILENHNRFLDEKEKKDFAECPYCFPENLRPMAH